MGIMKQALSIADIQDELGCGLTRAREIMLNELPHADIGAPGNRKPTWRAKRKDFDRWQTSRTEAAGNDRLIEFSRKHM